MFPSNPSFRVETLAYRTSLFERTIVSIPPATDTQQEPLAKTEAPR
jgi:hypothetical protein